MSQGFGGSTFIIRRKVFKLLGAAFHVYNENEQVVLFSNQKAFKLKEDIRMYTGEDMQTEVLSIQARQVLDFSAAYDVMDSIKGEKVGALKRKGLKSILRDAWIVMDNDDREIGQIEEDSMAMALVRRFLTNLIPQNFTATINGQEVCEYKQNFNPFVRKVTVNLKPAAEGTFDRRLALAAGVLLSAIEGRQN
jgi:uncharacterized protein YxjI